MKPVDGSIRDFQDETHYFIQMYRWGVWNTMIKVPLTEPSILSRLAAFMNGEGTLPHQPWPFPAPKEQTPEQTNDDNEAYERAKRVIENQR